MQILLILPFIFSINIFASSYEPTACILPPLKYGPAYIQADNRELQKWRKSLGNFTTDEEYHTLLNANENIKCLEVMPQPISQYRRCFQYAIETITGLNGFIDFPEQNRLSINLEKYFQQTPYPKKNDLIVYTIDEKNHKIHHFAVAIDQIWFKSKSGSLWQISEHLPFDLVELYGKAAWSFELRPEYQGDDGKKRVLQDMQFDIYNALGSLQDQNKQNKFNFFCFGAIAGIAYIVALQTLAQRYKSSLA